MHSLAKISYLTEIPKIFKIYYDSIMLSIKQWLMTLVFFGYVFFFILQYFVINLKNQLENSQTAIYTFAGGNDINVDIVFVCYKPHSHKYAIYLLKI